MGVIPHRLPVPFPALSTAIATSGRTQRDIARAAGMNYRVVSFIVRGERRPSAAQRTSLAAELGLPEHVLFAEARGVDEPYPSRDE
jgi:transcriptional regulator with XRE-family HTH domain